MFEHRLPTSKEAGSCFSLSVFVRLLSMSGTSLMQLLLCMRKSFGNASIKLLRRWVSHVGSGLSFRSLGEGIFMFKFAASLHTSLNYLLWYIWGMS